jgi:hemolysin III
MYPGERFNGYTHLAGTFLALTGAVVLVHEAAARADPLRLASFAIYGATLFLLYLFSTLYHSARGPAKRVLRKLDHTAIYLLIAGTYTPVMVVTLKDHGGFALCAAIWTVALIGILQEIWVARGERRCSLAIYLLMGWVAAVAMFPLLEAASWNGLAWMVAGGAVYTTGVLFYWFDDRFTHWHGIWHLFVMAGSAIHYLAIFVYVA